VVSRTWWILFSMPQRPRTHEARSAGLGLVGAQAGDAADAFEGDLASGEGPAAAHDLDGLGGVGEDDAAGDGAGLDPADLVAVVRGGAGSGLERNLPPGQLLQLLLQGGVVALDHGDVVGLLVLHQEADVLGLRVERVQGDHGVGQVERRQPGLEHGDLTRK